MTDITGPLKKKVGLEISTDLHHRVKTEALRRGVKMKDATEQAFESWLDTSTEQPDNNEDADLELSESADLPGKVQTTVRIPRELRIRLRTHAAALDISMDEYIQGAVEGRLAGVDWVPVNINFSNGIAVPVVLLEKLENLRALCDNIFGAVSALELRGEIWNERYRERSPVQQPDTHEIAEAAIQSLPAIGGPPAEIGHEAGDRGPAEAGPRDIERAEGPRPPGAKHPRQTKKRRSG